MFLNVSKVKLNDTADLEMRVTELEEEMVDVQNGMTLLNDEVDEVEDENILQAEQLLIVEQDVSGT